MNPTDLARVRTWVGSTPDDDEIADRIDRAGSADLAAREILAERLGDYLADPAKATIEGQGSEDASANIQALREQLDRLDARLGADSPASSVGAITTSRVTRPDRAR